MPWHTIVHSDLPIIETCYSGNMTKFELADAIHETLALGQTHNRTRFLGDCTTLSGGHTIFDLYSLAKEIPPNRAAYTLQEAIILPIALSFIENTNFWETVALKRGFKVRIFRDRQKALDWLMT